MKQKKEKKIRIHSKKNIGKKFWNLNKSYKRIVAGQVDNDNNNNNKPTLVLSLVHLQRLTLVVQGSSFTRQA